MCKLASFVVTRDRVLWHPDSDSHEKIIEHFKLNDKRANFVRVEMSPPGDNYLLPLSQWEFHTDQKNTPEWYSAKTEEAEVRRHMAKWKKDRLWFFDAMAFVKTIKDTPFFSAKGRKLKTWKFFDSRVATWAAARDAAGGATWAAARAAAGEAARDAAWNAAGDAAVDAARNAAGEAARAAAWVAAGEAAGDAAGDAAGEAAGDAEGAATVDAALLARCLVVSDKIDPKFLEHARDRWAVWQAGYGLLCDVSGVLYVYRKP